MPPSSRRLPKTKNARKKRDPQMHQTKKGHQWYFGMKAHLGVDAQSGLVHTVTGTAANVADIAQTHALLHGEEKTGHADAGYLGVEKRAEMAARSSGVEWHVAAKGGKIKAMAQGAIEELTQQLEKLKAQVRARVEHPFHILKNLFRHRKAPATAAWPRTLPNSTASSLWRTWSPPDAHC
jgi:transposase, IS5 family